MKIKSTNDLSGFCKPGRQRGASLLEGIAYLGIAAIVVLGAVSMLTSASSSAKANQTMEELVALRTSVKKLYAGQAFPTTAIVSTLSIANAKPGTLIYPGTGETMKNSWGGDVTVVGAAGGGSFSITYRAVPRDVCVSAISGASGWTGLTSASGGSATVFPVTAANAVTICGQDANDLTFTAS